MNRLVIMIFEEPFIHSNDCEFIQEGAYLGCLECRFASNFLIRLERHHFIPMELMPIHEKALKCFKVLC